jgi:ABC-type transport system involved in multi-copper enzyme maturation permease subunit
MNHVTGVLWAEVRKLLSRPVARFGLLLSVLIGVFGPLAILFVSNVPMQVQGEAVSFDKSLPNGPEWALVVRHWSWSTQLLLTVLAAVSFAGELQSHTLREDLVRPVDRWLVLVAKWASLGAWSLLSLVLQLAGATLLGLVTLSLSGEQTLSHMLAAYAASWPVELSFAAVALASAVLVRSVPGSIVAMVLLMFFERAFTLMSTGARGFFFDNSAFAYVPFTPTSAWSVWSEPMAGAPLSWQPWLALLVWTALATVLSQVVFARTDVP